MFKNLQASTTVFNADNKVLYDTKSAYLTDVWRIMWHWKLE